MWSDRICSGYPGECRGSVIWNSGGGGGVSEDEEDGGGS